MSAVVAAKRSYPSSGGSSRSPAGTTGQVTTGCSSIRARTPPRAPSNAGSAAASSSWRRPTFGKFFASTLTGSMVGSGPELVAVWGYVIANTVDSQVELNPRHVAGLLGMSPEAVQQCIERLCTPDPESRSKVADGRRLIREGEFAYFVPNHAAYRAVRDERDRREYNRLKKAEGRARGVNVRVKKSKRVNARVKRSTRESTVSAQAEAEAEAETTAASAAAVVPAAAQRSAAATWDILRGNLDTQHLEAI